MASKPRSRAKTNTVDLLKQLSLLSLDEIEDKVASGEIKLEQIFTPEHAQDIRSAVAAPRARGLREAVVILPGIMGSLLWSIRGVTTLLWINPLLFLNGQGGFLSVGPGGNSFGNPVVETAPFSLEKLTYLKIALQLRNTCAVYEFPYDWRIQIEANADALNDSIERWASANPDQRFTLVAHSMGGLVSRAYMGRHKANAEKRLKRLITLGTPHLGATSAVDNLFNGNNMMETVDKLNPQNGMRDVVLSMPAIYQLLPVPKELFPSGRPYTADWDLFDGAAWGVAGLRQENLDMAKGLHQFLAAQDPQVEIVQIAGCNISTLTDVQLQKSAGQPNQLGMTSHDEGDDSGDGTVPSWSANFAKAKLYFIQEVHKNLPNNMDVINAVQELLHDGSCGLPQKVPPKKTGLFARAPVISTTDQAAVLADKIRKGSINQDDLENIYFAF
jgi:pimeloyl-ACP methyl ester carboxylesterase